MRVPGSSAPKGSSSRSTLRLPSDRLGDREALLHAAGERARVFVAMRRQADLLDQAVAFLDGGAAGGAGEAAEIGALGELEGDEHIAEHGQVREDRIALEDDAAVGAGLGREGLAVDQDAAARRPLLAEDQAQERALAGAGRADHRKERAVGDVEIDALEHDLVAIFDPDVAERERAHQRRSST